MTTEESQSFDSNLHGAKVFFLLICYFQKLGEF
jgi:hypothetical protein